MNKKKCVIMSPNTKAAQMRKIRLAAIKKRQNSSSSIVKAVRKLQRKKDHIKKMTKRSPQKLGVAGPTLKVATDVKKRADAMHSARIKQFGFDPTSVNITLLHGASVVRRIPSHRKNFVQKPTISETRTKAFLKRQQQKKIMRDGDS